MHMIVARCRSSPQSGERKKAVSTNAISIRLSMDGKKYRVEGGGGEAEERAPLGVDKKATLRKEIGGR